VTSGHPTPTRTHAQARTRARRGVRVGVPLAGALAVSALLVAPSQAITTAYAPNAANDRICPGVPAPTVTSAAPDTALDSRFDTYADDHTSPDDWTGADSTYSAPLPDGRDVWIFSDTFLGTVNADGSRSPAIQDGGTTPFVNNTFVVSSRHDGDLRTVTGGTAATPTALLPPPDANHWYWARDGIAAGDHTLDVVYSEFARTGSGLFDFGWYANALAVFDTHHLNQPTTIVQLPSATGVSWGAWLLREHGYTYVYGTEDLGAHKYLHLARVRGSDLTGSWQYLTASGGWSNDEHASARVGGDASGSVQVSNEMSVVRHGNVYVLVTQDMSAPLSAGIDLAYSCTPEGPFVDETTAYTTPETGPYGSYHDGNVYTYNPHEHPELDGNGQLVISYNVNSFANTDLYKDASIYRPRFVTVQLSGN
jgi:hypothetical protein